MASLIDRVFGIEKRIALAADAAVEKAASTTFGFSQAFIHGLPLANANGPEQAYDNSWVAYSCIKRLATDAAGIPLVVLSDPDDKDSVVMDTHPLAHLLKYPSPHFSQSEMVQWWVTWLNLRGEFFSTFDDSIKPREIMFWSDPKDWRENMAGGRVASWTRREDGRHVTDPAMAVFQHRYINPANPWRGQAPLRAAGKAHSIDTGADALQEDIVARGGERAVLYRSAVDLTQPQRDQAVSQLRARRRGDGTVGKDVLLPNGVEVIDPRFIEDDMSVLNSQAIQPEKICAVYGLSRSLLGIEAIDQFATFKSRVKVYFTQTMIPMLTGIENSADRFVMRNMSSQYHGFMRFDLSKVDALAEDMAAKFEAAALAHAAGLPWTVCNERFDLGLDLSMIPGADVVLVSAGLVPIESITEAWDNPPEPEPEPEMPVPPVEPQTPPTAEPAQAGAPQAGTKSATGDVAARQEVITKRAMDSRSNLQRQVRLLKAERAMQDEWRKAVGVASRKTGALMAGVTVPAQVSGAVETGMAGLADRLVAIATKNHERAAREGQRAMVEIATGKMADAELEVWKARAPWGPGTKQFIATRQNLIKDMAAELFADVVAAATEAVTKGIESSKLVELVAQRFMHGPGGATRAVTIARTEIGSAYSIARHEEMKGQGFERHQWLTAADDGVRDGNEPGEFDHAKCNGEVVNVGDKFSCGLAYPMEAGGEAGNVINCRCETIPLIAGMEGF